LCCQGPHPDYYAPREPRLGKSQLVDCLTQRIIDRLESTGPKVVALGQRLPVEAVTGIQSATERHSQLFVIFLRFLAS